MAQCFTEAKPFSPSPLHMYGRAYSEQFYSSEHGNGSLDHVQVYNQGYNPRESSRKEGGLIRGYGSFGMPGAYKVNKEICHGRGDTGSHVKSSIKEEQSATGGSKEYLNGGSRAPNFDPNGIPTLLHSPHSYMQAEGRSSLEGALTIHSYCKSGIPGSLAGRCLSRGGLVETVPNLSYSSQSPNSARRSLDRSQLRDDSQQGNIASANNASGNGSEKGSAILWNESTGSSIVKGSPNTDRLSSGKLVIGSNLKVGDIPKPNQPSRGGFVRDNSLSESSAGGRIYSMDLTRGIATQVTAGSAEGVALAAISKPGSENATADNGGIAGPASAGENMNPLGRRHELLSQRTPAQSWPNSPANLRSVPRTRNLSEGSFNFIFPVGDFEKSMGGTRSNAGSPSRSSPRSWSTGADDSSSTAALRSSSDGYLLGMMYSPVNALGTVTRTKPNVEDSNELGSAGLHSPVKDLLLERATSNNERFSHGRQSSNDRGCMSTTNMKPSEFLGQKSMALSSEKNITQSLHATSPQSATYSSKFGTSATAKFTNSEHQNRSASDTCITQTVCSVPGMPVLSHSRDKSFNHGIIIGGSFGRRTLSPSPGVTIPNTVTVEGMAPPAFGNITKGSPNGTMPTIVTSSFGNIIKENSKSDLKKSYPQTNQADESFLLKRALSSKDPEEVKNYGNDQYKKGRYSEALLLYERAIILLPGQALFHSNRAAALAAVGRIGDAVQDCQEAIKLDPLYGRAHQRLASLLLRLGRVEDARWHLKAAGSLSDQRDIQRSDVILKHVAKCLEARMARDWASVIRESDATVVAGADSASKAFAFKAEALLHIGQTDEATRVISAAQKVESSLKRNTTLAESIVQVVQAKIDLALGKFQEAIVAAEKAVQIDSNNLEAAAVLQKARAIGRSRTMGNELYKAGKFFDASAAYGEGLEHDPANAILLCNRAACRSNLGLWESAIEDCEAALTAQPNYIKARLRRAHCFAKLEHWEEALADYEMLRRELPGDIEVARALFDVQAALEKPRGEELFKKSFGEGIDKVSSTNQFRAAVTSPGLAVVHFNSEDNVRCRQLSAFVIQLRKRHPAVNFVKVDVDENHQLAKLENVTTVPTFQLYRNGLKVKELEGPSYETLEQAIQLSIL